MRKKKFSKKLWHCHTQHYIGPENHAEFQKNESIPRRRLLDRRTDGQTLIHGTLPGTAGDPIKTNII